MNTPSISFDVWGTLLVSNPKFKTLEKELARDIFKDRATDFMKLKLEVKNRIDEYLNEPNPQVKHLFSNWEGFDCFGADKVLSFRKYYDALFLEHPPLLNETDFHLTHLMDSIRKHYTVYISSNTVYAEGYLLSQVLWNYFKIPDCNCKFSDQVQENKPHRSMFWEGALFHVGDNKMTDGKCVSYGINFYQITKTQTVNTFASENLNLCP